MTISILDALKTWQGLPHQQAAAQWLMDQLSPEVAAQFSELYLADPPPKPQPSPSPGVTVDWLTPCLSFVKNWEGCRLVAYPDPGAGPDGKPWTIGWGHTGPEVKQGLTINQLQADAQLALDLKDAHQGLIAELPLAASWGADRQAALTSFTFNVGRGLLAQSSLKRRFLAGDDPVTVVRQELPRWVNGAKGPLPGLVRRRAAEVELFCGGPAGAATGPSAPAGLVGPKKRPDFKPGDHHLIANDQNQSLTAWTHDGRKLWSIPCLCRGQGAETDWKTPGSDTPPGLYLVGQVYRDYQNDPSPAHQSKDRQAYGWFSFDLEGQEGQEGSGTGRDGIMMHGGGSACGWPGAWAPMQQLFPTEGCIRLHNQDLRDRILPLLDLGRIWVSVYQEAPVAS